MSLVLEEDGVVARRTISKLIRVYPGEVITLGLNVHGPRGHVVEIIIEEQSSIAKITVSPNSAKAPYFAKMVVEVLPSVEPGLY